MCLYMQSRLPCTGHVAKASLHLQALAVHQDGHLLRSVCPEAETCKRCPVWKVSEARHHGALDQHRCKIPLNVLRLCELRQRVRHWQVLWQGAHPAVLWILLSCWAHGSCLPLATTSKLPARRKVSTSTSLSSTYSIAVKSAAAMVALCSARISGFADLQDHGICHVPVHTSIRFNAGQEAGD
jgi:hypothetical protein